MIVCQFSVDTFEENNELNEPSVVENSDSAKENESEDTEHIPFNPAGEIFDPTIGLKIFIRNVASLPVDQLL